MERELLFHLFHVTFVFVFQLYKKLNIWTIKFVQGSFEVHYVYLSLLLSVIWPDVSVTAMQTTVIPLWRPTAVSVCLRATQRETMWVTNMWSQKLVKPICNVNVICKYGAGPLTPCVSVLYSMCPEGYVATHQYIKLLCFLWGFVFPINQYQH